MSKKNKDRQKSKEVNPEVWLARIKALPKEVRYQIGNIIWWDNFGEREVSKRWHHLDYIICKRVAVTLPDDEIFKHLVACGYSERLANIRVNRSVNGNK